MGDGAEAWDEARREQLRSSIRSYVDTALNPHVGDWERRREMPIREIFRDAGELGLFGLCYGERYGGQGAPLGVLFDAGEEIGRIACGAVPMALNVQMVSATAALHRFGSEQLGRQYLAPAIRGEMIAGIAVTELHAGSDVAAITTSAVRDGDSWVINGEKAYIANAATADWHCALVKTDPDQGTRGMTQILVPTATPGVSTSERLETLGMRAIEVSHLRYENVRVPVANTIGTVDRGFHQAMSQFEDERLVATFVAVGAMRSALEKTYARVQERNLFGATLGSNQYVQYTLAELDAELELLRVYVQDTVRRWERGESVLHAAAVAKLKAGRLERQLADTCVQLHGAVGYMDDDWPSRFYRDARLLSIGGGADEVMLRVLAEHRRTSQPS
jgi:citronellyl-CoA dehydrogenase